MNNNRHSTPMVSIIVPASNPGKYLDQALESLLAQTYSHKEIIVVDDGSDPPCESLSSYRELVTFCRQPHSGAAEARNKGFLRAKGDLVAFCDADDLYHVNKITTQVEYLLENRTTGYVMTLLTNFLEPGVEMPDWFKGESSLKERQGFVSTALIRRETIELVGIFDSRFQIGEDLDWLIRAQDLGIKSHTINEVLVERRIHSSNTSANIKLGHSNLMQILRESLMRRKQQDASW